MAKPHALRALLDLAERQKGEAATRLGGLNAQVSSTESKLNLLLDYREEYRARFRAALRRDTDVNGLRNFRDFLARLDQAIDQQRGAVTRSREIAKAGQQDWQSKHCRVKAFDTLAQRHANVEAKRIARAEQRQSDEFAARGHGRRQRDS